MKKIVYIFSVVVLLLHTTSCKKDFLDVEPLDRYGEEAVWNDPALIQTYVNGIYRAIPHGFHALMMSSLVDESLAVWGWESENVTKSLITPSYLGVWDPSFWTGRRFQAMQWNMVYKNVRACNVFLEKIKTAPFEDEEFKKRLTGEVHFLRAFLYHNLVSVYGGVPIITEAYGLNSDFAVPRDSYEDCIKFIAEDCDKAADFLPLIQTDDNKGRATKGAALALKARTLLYAASDLHDIPTLLAKTPEMATDPEFSNPDNQKLLGYLNGDRNVRWQAAKDAAKAVIDLGVYSLYKAEPASGDSIAKNYGEIFLLKETSEDIFVRYFLQRTDEDWDSYNPGLYNGPNGYHNWGGNVPLGQLVDDYEMRDGTRFSWDNPVHKANPYENRDPRFYATILYEGAQWRKRPADVEHLDPDGIIQVGVWVKPGGAEVHGLDTKGGPIETWNATLTGYYLKKFIDPAVDAQYVKQDVPWRHIRYTEVLLNYAEACLGLGQEAEARQYINMVRKRVGMPETNESGPELINRYRNERRVELAYEDHRFFDVRRWLIAPQAYTDAKGVNVRYELQNGTTAINPTFTVIEVQDRAWRDRAYFLPIKLDEMNKNDKLVQNPLYE